MTKTFCKNNYQLKAVNCFDKNSPPEMFDKVLDTPLKILLDIWQGSKYAEF